MKCSVNGNNARTIAKAIQSLAKFSNDLYIEADQNALQLRSFNSSKSAMGTFRFKKIFFDTYQTSSNGENYCKIAMKVCLGVFKNMKQVEYCNIQLLSTQAKLQIQFKCRLETIKNALISIVDEENVTTTVTADNANNRIVGSYKVFNDITNNFNSNELEITLEMENDGLKVKNYIEGARVNDRFMRSQLRLSINEFEVYSLQQETTITFCLKEFRAFLAFAESLNESITLQFDQPGDPVFLNIQKLDLIECNLIMSTLYPDDVSFYDDLRECEVNELSATPMLTVAAKTTQKRKHTESPKRTKKSSRRRNSDTATFTTATTLSNDTSLFRFNSNKKVPTSIAPTSPMSPTDSFNHNDDIQTTENDCNLLPEEVAVMTEPTLKKPQTQTDKNNAACVTTNNEEMDDFIPQSPQRQRTFLRVFSRCFENTYRPKEPSPNSQVFVPDSDTEN